MNKHTLENLLALDDFSELYKKAHKIKEDLYGKDIYIRAILEFSNHCKMDCIYCGLNCHNKKIKRYRMSENEILENAVKAHEAGYKTLVMQSGEDVYFTAQHLGNIVKKIKKTGIAVTLSCGEMSFEAYKYLKDCGADRYLLKHECSDNAVYSRLHTKSTLQQRLHCLKNLHSLGYETGSGFMIGLPNQNLATIANDILKIAEIPCDMAGIGPFIPHPDTPLKDMPKGSTELTKRAVALTRILMKKINLPATTSLGVIDCKEKNDIFLCGANVIMQKVTPEPYKSLYEIYPSVLSKTDIIKERKELEAHIKALGCVPV
ncbi:MAG: [FeFe] hydrogenase H-cluster radical SAM maturase HydE [Spirochaetales bacterium]